MGNEVYNRNDLKLDDAAANWKSHLSKLAVIMSSVSVKQAIQKLYFSAYVLFLQCIPFLIALDFRYESRISIDWRCKECQHWIWQHSGTHSVYFYSSTHLLIPIYTTLNMFFFPLSLKADTGKLIVLILNAEGRWKLREHLHFLNVVIQETFASLFHLTTTRWSSCLATCRWYLFIISYTSYNLVQMLRFFQRQLDIENKKPAAKRSREKVELLQRKREEVILFCTYLASAGDKTSIDSYIIDFLSWSLLYPRSCIHLFESVKTPCCLSRHLFSLLSRITKDVHVPTQKRQR